MSVRKSRCPGLSPSDPQEVEESTKETVGKTNEEKEPRMGEPPWASGTGCQVVIFLSGKMLHGILS